jgi:hypothetical protein
LASEERASSIATAPATSPQKGAPTPQKLKPEAVTAKVMKAACLDAGSSMATAKALEMVPNKDKPATTITKALGNAANKLTTDAPASPANM